MAEQNASDNGRHDDAVADAVAAVALILLAVATAAYWLWGLTH